MRSASENTFSLKQDAGSDPCVCKTRVGSPDGEKKLPYVNPFVCSFAGDKSYTPQHLGGRRKDD